MKKKILFLMMILIFLVGCGKTTQDLEATAEFQSMLETAIVETIAAALPEATATSESVVTTATLSPVASPVVPSPTAPLVATAIPTNTPVTVEPTATSQIPCYRGELISETIPDFTKQTAGSAFYKNWVIRNTGVCAWTEDFRWVHVDGEDFNGLTDIRFARVVMPGEDLVVKMDLKAPVIPGTYKGTYQILTDTGGTVTPYGFYVLIISE